MYKSISLFFGITSWFLATFGTAACAQPLLSPVSIEHMTCEYLVNPQGIDARVPRISWIESSSLPGFMQTAYRVIVASSPDKLSRGVGDLWDSGKVASRQTTQISYRGSSLRSRERCWWKVQVWDNGGLTSHWSSTASFTMGLLSLSDWKGVWIGKNTSASADDKATLQSAHWIWYPDSGQPTVAAPLGTRFFRANLNTVSNRAIKDCFFIGTADNQFTLYLNGKKCGGGSDWTQVQKIDLTGELHSGSNVIAVSVTNVGADGPNPAGMIGAFKIDYADNHLATVLTTGSSWISTKSADTSWKTAQVDQSQWKPVVDLGSYGISPWGDLFPGGISASSSGAHAPLPARYLRREFVVTRKVSYATVYACGLGFNQLYLNGKPANDHIMDPALSDYRKADYYVTTDVTRLLRNGNNAIGVLLGNGRFYSPRSTVPTSLDNTGMPRLLLQLEIVYTDGTIQTIVSDKRWAVSDQGPIRANNEYDGEVYDARMALTGWTLPGYHAQQGIWQPAQILPPPGGVLCAQMIEPMRIVHTVVPVSVTTPKQGIYIVDMGQTFYGTVRLRAAERRGTTVNMTSSYQLLPDGTLKTADNRTARATDIYTFAGKGTESWNPIFKGQGYRRIQVTGFPGIPTTKNFTGLAENTDVRSVGSFTCSDSLVNQIHEAMRTGMLMFLRSAPLDPDRDERQAWMGDPAKDSESDAYNFDVAAFYSKWMDDVRRSQHADGTIPDVSMYWDSGNGVEWPSVFTIIPDWYTQFYSDNEVEERNYDAMKRWVLTMKTQHTRPDGTLEATSYGDWCDTYTMGGKVSDFGFTARDLISSAYQYNNERIMQHAAERLGKTDDIALFRSMADILFTAFMNKFYDPMTSTYTSQTQCSYVLPLQFGLLPSDPDQRKKIVDNLVNDIMVTHNRHLTVGLIGNQWLLQTLSEYGRSDVAWTLLTQTTQPSWGYMIKYGSKTIWERWDYDTRDPGMNSEALLIQAGNVDAWLYQTLGGINYDPKAPGFAHIRISPQVVGDLQWVNCSFDSPHGLIVSNWKRSKSEVTLDVTIPANTTATVITPDGRSRELESGHWQLRSGI